MEAINSNNEVNTQEETAPEIPAATEEDYVQTSIEEAATPSASTADERTKKTDQQQSNQPKEKPNFEGNLLYAENLGFIPGAMYGGNLDPRHVFCKFRKDYKEFDYTNEDILVYLEQNNLLQYLTLLQISKPNKSIDIVFPTEDVADFLINKHKGVRKKLLPFVRKAKRILKVMVKGVHPEMSNELLVSELFDYIKHVSSIRNSYRQYDGTTYCNGTRQIFVTNLARHIPRSLKIGNRWCLVFYRDQPVLHRRLPCISTIVETPNSEELPPPQMELEVPGPGTSVGETSDTNSEQSDCSWKIITDKPMPEASLTSKRVSEP